MMKQNIFDLNWARILITSALVLIVGVMLVFLIIMGYVLKMGIEARGAPDQARIGEFAAKVGPLWGPILGVFVTLVGAAWVARRAVASPIANSVAVGVVVAVVALVIDWAINFATLGAFALTIIAGWLGGLVGHRRHSAMSAMKEVVS